VTHHDDNPPLTAFDGDVLVSRKQAARILTISPHTLSGWDCYKVFDLQPIRIGRCVRYRLSVLRRFVEERQQPKR